MDQSLNSSKRASRGRAQSKNADYCGKNFLQSILYVFNTLFWLTGAAFLAVGLYILINRHSFVSLLGSTTFPITTYLLVATGALILLIGVLGCVGTCQENRCCLFTFAFFLLLIFLLEAVAGVLSYMYAGVIKEQLTRNLNETMMTNYNYDTTITQAIDEMQIEFKCCGAESFEDWKHSKWIKALEEANAGGVNKTNKTPDSCCKSPSNLCAIRDHPSNIDYIGCSRRLEQFTKESLILIGGVGLGLCCVQIFGIIFSCCLIRKIKEVKYRY